jgi:hypothetical protein
LKYSVILAKHKPVPIPTSVTHAPTKTQQFGVELSFIKQNNNGDIIPPVVSQCISYLRSNGLDTEGLFRRSASAVVLKQVQKSFNDGETIDFDKLANIHIPAAILKSFLRQLPEPLLTYELYDHIIHLQSLEEDERLIEMRRILTDELVEDNYFILKYVVNFLTEVVEKSEVNKMTAQNLAIIFGPNLMWSKSQASLVSLGYVNACVLLLISHYHDLFAK